MLANYSQTCDLPWSIVSPLDKTDFPYPSNINKLFNKIYEYNYTHTHIYVVINITDVNINCSVLT